MSTEPCTQQHTYTITGRDGTTLATTQTGPKLAWVLWTNAGENALDLTATHPDGTRCATETRAVRALLPGGPYESRQQASIDGQPLRDAVNAATGEHDGPLTDAEYDAMRQAATDYLTTRLTRFGVELGVFDQRIAAWMADWEPHVVAVILGWVQRAHQAGRDSAASRC